MTTIRNISATFFDMDGTLVDSETLTGPTIEKLCDELGVHDVVIEPTQLYGLSWLDIEQILLETYPQLADRADIPGRLQEIFHEMLRDNPPPLIRNSRESVVAANRVMPTAIISSSGRQSIEETIRRMDIADSINYYAGFEDYEQCKPAPDGYLKAADMLRTNASECLVFEDSIVGIQAAKNASMQVIAITHRCNDITAANEIADLAINDYSELDDGFFDLIRKGN
jgi:beta-phosphoglucomutase-like phosphatase (HAD superfamily)